MDWKYKHFSREADFPAERQRVYEAARAFVAEALPGWQAAETGEGFEMRGSSAGHTGTANFRFVPTSGGTKVAVALQMARSSAMGFMLWDAGGYYDTQIRHWLDGIRVFLEHGADSANPQAAAEQRKKAVAKSQLGGKLFAGCILLSLFVIVSIYAIAALVGLITGTLWLPGRGSSDVTLHGMWARIISAGILSLFGWIAYRMWKPKRRKRSSEWLPPP